MSDSATYQVHVGAAGWEESKLPGFYPDDLPPEWRLTYYNNFFSCVYLTYAEWSGQQDATIQQWLNDVLPRFRFVLQLPAAGPSVADIEKLQGLGEQVGLLVAGNKAPQGLIWLEDFAGPQEAVQQAKKLVERGEQVFIVSRANNFALLENVSSLLEVERL
ncbi:MAG: hypothetical protein OEV35_09495 [Gallionellaceae bacterium]|nr:hypothetical protein [Gallionellaceae bacterium]